MSRAQQVLVVALIATVVLAVILFGARAITRHGQSDPDTVTQMRLEKEGQHWTLYFHTADGVLEVRNAENLVAGACKVPERK